MRKLTLILVGLAALVASSVAVAHGIAGARSAASVAGTFSATGSAVSTRTCTTSDSKTIVVANGTYKGTASGAADLTGDITLRTRSVVNTTDGVGTVNGRFAIDAKGRHTRGVFSTVYDHGALAGLATGRAHEPSALLLGNVSATFDPAKGFSNGKIGGGTAGGGAVEITAAGCKPQGAQGQKEHSEARGNISALSTTSITVAGLTCAIASGGNARMSAILPKLKVGDRVDIRCDLANGQNVLARLDKLR